MAGALIVAELADGQIRKSSYSAITFGRELGVPFAIVVMGAGAAKAAKDLTAFGAQKVLVVDDASLANYVCERFAPTIAKIATDGAYDTVAVTASAFGKDLAPRVAAKLGAGYVPDIDLVKVDGGNRRYRRPEYAGNALAWVEVATSRHVVSIRQTEFPAALPNGGTSSIEIAARAPDDAAAARVEFLKLEATVSQRPDLAEARVVVSGGRALNTTRRRAPAGKCLFAVQEKCFHKTLALDLDRTAALEIEPIAERKTRRGGDLNPAGQRVRLHTARGIHRVAPDVVGEFVRADDAGNNRAAMNPDARLKFEAGGFGNVVNCIEHAYRQRGDAERVVFLHFGNSRRCHIGVADGLDLFHAQFGGKPVDGGTRR